MPKAIIGPKIRNVDQTSGKTKLIELGPEENKIDIDAGIVMLYKVTHEFISGTPGKDLPPEVKALTPENQTGKKNGEEVTPTVPSKTSVEVEDGFWTFVSYDREKDTIDIVDEHFIGKWVFEAKKGNVFVEYITEDGKVLEAESQVKKDAPVGENYSTEQKIFKGYEFVRMEKTLPRPKARS